MKRVAEKQIMSVMNWAKDYARAAIECNENYDKTKLKCYLKMADKYFYKLEAVCMTLEILRIVDNWRDAYNQALDNAYRELHSRHDE